MAARRREKGSGSVYEDRGRPGRWIGEVVVDGKRRRVSGKDKTEVRAKLRNLVAKRELGLGIGDSRVTVAQVVDSYLEREVPNLLHNGRPLAPRTVESYRWAGDTIKAELGTVRLAKLTIGNVEAMYDRLASRPVRPLNISSLRKLANKLTSMLTFAEKRGLVARNVARLATITPTAAGTRRRRALDPGDARRLLAQLRHEYNGAMFALSLRLGLRPGEAAGLYWDDVFIDGAPLLINVTRGVRLNRGRAEVSDDLKTSAAKRTLALPEDLAAWLREHRQAQRKRRLASAYRGDDRLVFTSLAGNVLDPKNVRDELDAICERAGVMRVTPNELRHSCASLLADEGVSNEAIADLLGHTTTRMVDQTYRHRLRPVVDVATRATWAEAT
jgi:integrase